MRDKTPLCIESPLWACTARQTSARITEIYGDCQRGSQLDGFISCCVCNVNTVDGPADTINFLQFFEEAYNSLDPITHQLCLKAEDIMVMDNAPKHHNASGEILGEFLADLGIELVHMHVYSSDFNPVEYVFGKLRTLMKYQFKEVTERNVKDSSYMAIEQISPRDMAGFYNVTGYLNV